MGGLGLRAVDAPRGASPSLDEVEPGLFAFVPDRPGRYVLAGPDDAAFSIFAGSHETTPLDCGRAECHRRLAADAALSPMTTVLARLVEVPSYTPACAIACHAVGEPGTSDGGFVAVASALGAALPAHGANGELSRLPRELRRLGGVGCTSCHGPGAIPEPAAAERILRADVCAVCHDAPPRYGHVAAWRTSRMARADAHERVRDDAACARCHTTAGFVGRPIPEGTDAALGPVGIACAACHAPHADRDATLGSALLRKPELPVFLRGVESTLAEAPSRVCVACHAPADDSDVPTASAVALVSGRGAIARDGSSLELDAPHAALERGCLACHGTRTDPSLERGASHSFAVDPSVCASCHEDHADRGPEILARAEALAARIAERGVSRPTREGGDPGVPTSTLSIARWDVGLVLLDRGAFIHAGATATAILDEAEAIVGDAERDGPR